MNATATIQSAAEPLAVRAANDTVFPAGARLRRTIDFTPALARLHAASVKAVQVSGVAASEVAKRALSLTRTLWSWLCNIIAKIFRRTGQQPAQPEVQTEDGQTAAQQTQAQSPPMQANLTDAQLTGQERTAADIESLPGREADQQGAVDAIAQEADALVRLAEMQGPDLVMLDDERLGASYLEGISKQYASHAARYEAQAAQLRAHARQLTESIARAQGVEPGVIETMIAANGDGGLLDRNETVRKLLAQAVAAEVAAQRTRASLQGLLKAAACKEHLAPVASALASELLPGLDVHEEPVASPVSEVMFGSKASAKKDSAMNLRASEGSELTEFGGASMENITPVMYDTKEIRVIPGDSGSASLGKRRESESAGEAGVGRDDFPYAPRPSPFAALAKLNPIEQDDRPDIDRDRY